MTLSFTIQLLSWVVCEVTPGSEGWLATSTTVALRNVSGTIGHSTLCQA